MSPAPSPNLHGRKTRLSGAILGILVFLVGIALIGSVFVMARALFDAAPPVIPPSAFATPLPAASGATLAATPTGPPATVIIGQSLAQFLQKLLVLLVMCIAGSAVASKGVDLFFKSLAPPRAAVESLPPLTTP